MNTRDQNGFQSFVTVRATLATHEPNKTWTGLPALVRAVDDLDEVIAGIAAHLLITALPNGAAGKKKSLLKELAPSAHEVAAAVHAYATEADDVELAAQVDLSVTDIAQGRPALVVTRCRNIVALATEHLDSLAESNITSAKLTALTKKITAFEKQAPKPRQGVARKASANKALGALMASGRNILKRRIDKLMVQFRESAPELYAEYKTARKIVNSAAPSREKKAASAQSQSAPATNASATNGTATHGVATEAKVVATNGMATEAKVAVAPAQNGHSAAEAASESTEALARAA